MTVEGNYGRFLVIFYFASEFESDILMAGKHPMYRLKEIPYYIFLRFSLPAIYFESSRISTVTVNVGPRITCTVPCNSRNSKIENLGLLRAQKIFSIEK